MKITVSITTRGRYETTLPLSLMSIINQSLLPYEIILVDDNDNKDFYNIKIFKEILKLIKLKGVKFSYFYGESKGQVYAQQIALNNCSTELIYKMDDDNILESNVLEILYNTITKSDKIGAVSGLILNDKDKKRELNQISDLYNKIDDIYSNFNIQMCGIQSKDIKRVEHIYSNFLFKVSLIREYALEFYPSGHREDTVVTYELYLKGYDLLINPNCIIWHLNENNGGNRLHENDNKNEILFINKLKKWGVIPDKIKVVEDLDTVYTMKGFNKFLIYKKN